MRALNEKESILLHVKFGVHMVFLVSITLFFIFTFVKASQAEVTEINLKTGDSEKIFYAQMELSADIEDFLTRYKSFEVSNKVNSELLMLSIVDRKMEIIKKIETLPENDVKIHSYMMSKMDEFLRVRDSISTLKKDELTIKNDLMICSEDYKSLKKRKGLKNGRK